MRVISAVGGGVQGVISGVSAGLCKFGVSHLTVSGGATRRFRGGRNVDGYAIEGDRDAVGSSEPLFLSSATEFRFLKDFRRPFLSFAAVRGETFAILTAKHTLYRRRRPCPPG